MITLDKLRDALRQPQPWTAMDELVRAEQAAGRKVQEIHDELRALVEPVRALDNPTEDADDAMMDTLDALAGNCRSDSAYYDPPNTPLPTEEEIAKLPRWARVAFTARCARRALPVFRLKWPDAPPHYNSKLSAAVELSELSAALGGRGEDVVDYARAATLATYVSDAAINAARDRKRAAEVVNATVAVFSKLKGVPIEPFDIAVLVGVHNASIAIANGIATGHDTYGAASLLAETAIRRDFDHLARFAERQRWTDDTPVPPEVFGPLWPEGPPPGWPADPDAPQQTQQPVAV